jgi:prepilin-type N-terminal cleavage/methylation domain-containing protein
MAIKKQYQQIGFTIIEVMMVLSIAALIMVLIALGASEAQKTRRDNERKAYARQVYGALEDFYKNNGKFPGCVSGCSTADMVKFMQFYLPDGSDPLTGAQYHKSSYSSVSDPAYSDGLVIKPAVGTNGAAVYIDNGVHHNLLPNVGQIYIATAHWCYSTRSEPPGANTGPPLAGIGLDRDVSKFALVIYQERGGYYCLDNYSD